MATFTPRGLVLPDPPTILNDNLLPEPRLFNLTWEQRGSTGAISHALTTGPNGTGYFEYAMDTANTSSPMGYNLLEVLGTLTPQPVVPGEQWTVSAWWFKSVAGQTQRFDVQFYDVDGNFTSNQVGADLGLIEGEFIRKHRTFIVPEGAFFAAPGIVWSGTYPGGTILRNADAQLNKGLLADYTEVPVTADDGDIVNVGQLNANLDRMSDLGVGSRPILSSERPSGISLDGERGNLVYETDTGATLIRRNGFSASQGNADPNWRVVIPGEWHDFSGNNIWSGWLSGDNNKRAARYMLLGRICFVHIEAEIGPGGDIFGNIALTSAMPVSSDNQSEASYHGYAYGGDDLAGLGPWPVGGACARKGSDIWYGRVIMSGSANIGIRSIPDTNTSGGSLWGATVPDNWAVGDSIAFDFWYFTT